MTLQQLCALALVLSYLLLSWRCLASGRRDSTAGEGRDDGADTVVAYASQSGTAQRLARQYAALLPSARVLPLNAVDAQCLDRSRLALFFISTYGEGEAPDNGLRFLRSLHKHAHQELQSLRFAVLALGDSSYQQFCNFGRLVEGAMLQRGAVPLFSTVTVDRECPQALARWLHLLHDHGLISQAPPQSVQAEREEAIVDWQLIDRSCLNPHSQGAPVFHIRLQPQTATMPHWKPGDIVRIAPRNDPQLPWREYSIASLPEEGTLDLLVRQVQFSESKASESDCYGLGSGWLTRFCPPASRLSLTIRSNPAFHPPASGVPMILIGSGTGMAGLRAHLKAREAAGQHANWLIFGERCRSDDLFFEQDIQSWLACGHLQEADLVFSRDPSRHRYVQHVITARGDIVQQWLEQGAAIYVCGSRQGMAAGVHQALLELLGEEQLDLLSSTGRYQRDIY